MTDKQNGKSVPTSDEDLRFDVSDFEHQDADENTGKDDYFAPENLVVSQDFASAVGVEKILTDVRLRKPARHEFVRVHESGDHSLGPVQLVKDADEGEFYLVDKALGLELLGESKMYQLYETVTRRGSLFLWPIPLPDELGRLNPWHKSAFDAVEYATRSWVRIIPNQPEGRYDILRATADLGDPEWPEPSFQRVLKLAFADRIIADMDHPLVKRLWGR